MRAYTYILTAMIYRLSDLLRYIAQELFQPSCRESFHGKSWYLVLGVYAYC